MVRRNLKSQIRRDAKRVFLNPDELGEMEHILYFRNGGGKPPIDLFIPVVVTEDENMNSVWNKNKNQQRVGSDQTIFQLEKILFCAWEDFSPPPKKGRRIQVGDRVYEVLGVGKEGGLLKIELRELEE